MDCIYVICAGLAAAMMHSDSVAFCICCSYRARRAGERVHKPVVHDLYVGHCVLAAPIPPSVRAKRGQIVCDRDTAATRGSSCYRRAGNSRIGATSCIRHCPSRRVGLSSDGNEQRRGPNCGRRITAKCESTNLPAHTLNLICGIGHSGPVANSRYFCWIVRSVPSRLPNFVLIKY